MAKHKPELGNEAPKVVEKVVVKLTIPEELYAGYEELAEKQGLTVEELMLHRLKRCKDFNGLRPLFFSDVQRQKLEDILQKRPLESADQAVAALSACLTIRISEFEPISLTAQQVKRLGMSGYAGQNSQDRLAQIVRGAVSKAVGI